MFKLIKLFVVYPFIAFIAFATVLGITGYEPAEKTVEAKVEKPVKKVAKAEVKLPALHQKCFNSKNAQPNPFKAGTIAVFEPTGKFGTYDDGELWITINTKIVDMNKKKITAEYKNVNVICKPNGAAY